MIFRKKFSRNGVVIKYIGQLLIFVLISIVFAGMALAIDFSGFRLLKISPADHRAVVQNPAGTLQVIAVGDEIAGALVTEVTAGRVVLSGQGGEMSIVRLENGKQRSETIRRLSEPKPTMLAPVSPESDSSPRVGTEGR